MLELIVPHGPWIPVLLWAGLYVSDYTLTLVAARLYRDRVRQHIVFEGSYELTPYFEKDVEGLRRFSPRFALALAATALLLILLWFLARELRILEAFSLAFGALVLLQGAIHVRHLRNLALFRRLAERGGVEGHLLYRRWLVLESSASELFAFALLFLVLSALDGSWFLLGGALSCLATGSRHRRLARTVAPAAQQNDETEPGSQPTS